MAFETIYYQEFNKTTDQLQADGILAPGGWLRFNNQKIASGNYVITLVYKKDFAVNRGYLLIDSRFTPSDAIETIPAESCFFNLWDYKNYDFYIASGTNKWYGFNDSPDDPNDEVIIKIEIDLYRKTSSVHRNGLFMYSERLRYDEYGNIPFEDFIFSFWAEESPNYPNAVGGLIKSLKIENERTFETLFYMEVEKSNQA